MILSDFAWSALDRLGESVDSVFDYAAEHAWAGWLLAIALVIAGSIQDVS
jgi:hypothetical protein